MLGTLGSDFGYFPNDKKRWIIAKPDKRESVKEVFKKTDISKTMEEKNHLRAVIGPREYLKEFVGEEVSDLVSEVVWQRSLRNSQRHVTLLSRSA